MKILITGGTVFVSRYAATYFSREHEVFVLNRNTRTQVPGVTLIEADRHALGDCLKGRHFDAVLDITAYTEHDVSELLDASDSFDQYVFISSSAVYPETLPQPFREDQPIGPNSIWGLYGLGKVKAEQLLHSRVPHAYILRPPYLYGPMQNIYREPFVFECADANRPFLIPGDGSLPLQFFHVEDLCRFIEILLEQKPEKRIFNVGNPEPVDVCTWVSMCYQASGKEAKLIEVHGDHEQRAYFPFHSYAYHLDVSLQHALMPQTKSLAEGLRESFEWYLQHPDECRKKPFMHYIDQFLL